MTDQSYQCNISTPISRTEAFDKISRVSGWWSEDFTGSAQRLGETFTVRFGETFVDFKIVEDIPDEKIVWKVIESYLPRLNDKTEWNGTSILWEAGGDNGVTSISMTHQGLVPAIECYGDCREGWNFYVEKSLLQFLTSDKGLPSSRQSCVAAETV